jgi:hypothetical protein
MFEETPQSPLMFKRYWWVLFVMVPLGSIAGLLVAAVITYVMPNVMLNLLLGAGLGLLISPLMALPLMWLLNRARPAHAAG